MRPRGLIAWSRMLRLVLAGACVLQAPAHGGEAATASAYATNERGYLTFYLDNDLFGGTDRNYTNGARLSWISEAAPLVARSERLLAATPVDLAVADPITTDSKTRSSLDVDPPS